MSVIARGSGERREKWCAFWKNRCLLEVKKGFYELEGKALNRGNDRVKTRQVPTKYPPNFRVFGCSRKGGYLRFLRYSKKGVSGKGIPDISGHFSFEPEGYRAGRESDPYPLFSWIDEDRSGGFWSQ